MKLLNFLIKNRLPKRFPTNLIQYTFSPQHELSKRFYSEGGGAGAASTEEPLYDLHGRRHDYLRISLTERCNLRCRYCMPAEGAALSARAALLSRAETVRVARALAAAGVAKLRLTGGEPTLRRDLAALVAELAALAGVRAVAMTSNGVALARALPALRRAGLSHLNLSLDTLRPERYEAVTRRPAATLARVLATVDVALQLGYSPLKLNVVLMRGFNDDEIGDFVDFTRDRDVEVRFIEFMPFAGNRWDGGKLVPGREALRAAAARAELLPAPPRPHDTARLWRAVGHRGAVGFISSMTQPFCSTCNRLRLTADGNLKVCLFGAAEVSLRDALRAGASDADVLRLVRGALAAKRAQHAGECRPRAAAAGAPAASPPRAACRRAAAGAQPGGAAHGAHRRLAARGLCSLSHVDAAGRARMVDVGAKPVTRRAAEAACGVRVSASLLRLLRAGGGAAPKGDALAVARVAGVLAAKRTADLIPLCHPLPLACVRVRLELPAGAEGEGGEVAVRCEVRVEARTGAEMEALTGCAVAALTLYDMCKAVDRHMRITDLRLVRKEGGRSSPPAAPAPADGEPLR